MVVIGAGDKLFLGQIRGTRHASGIKSNDDFVRKMVVLGVVKISHLRLVDNTVHEQNSSHQGPFLLFLLGFLDVDIARLQCRIA